MRKRLWTGIVIMSHPHRPRDIDLSLTFPLALRPVSQIVTPFCSSRSTRSDDSTEPGWKVMLVAMGEVLGNRRLRNLTLPCCQMQDTHTGWLTAAAPELGVGPPASTVNPFARQYRKAYFSLLRTFSRWGKGKEPCGKGCVA